MPLNPIIILHQFFQMTMQSVIFPENLFIFLFQIHTLKEKVSKAKYVNVYFVIRGNIQFKVFFSCLG